MPQAVLPLLMNTLVASMFVASFLTIAYLNPLTRSTRWIALSYSFGALEPVADLAVVLGANPAAMRLLAAGSFLVGLAMMSPALSIFYGKRPRWAASGAIVACGLLYFSWTLGQPRNLFWVHFGFQAFFAAATALSAFTARQDAPRSAMSGVLCGVFIVTTLHFFMKPFAAIRFGTGATEQDYAGSLYAVLSQASSGVLLVAGGLIILISVLQTVVQSNHGQARTDPLTGLPNRLALHEAFELLNGRMGSATAALAIIDLDRFKSINDRFGHDVGDEVLRSVAACLDRIRPSAAIVARIGGEEFVLLLPHREGEPARLMCEAMRLSIASLTILDCPPITASIGLTTVAKGEDLADALRRADRALYEAKNSGRDRCVIADLPQMEAHTPHLSLVGAQRRG